MRRVFVSYSRSNLEIITQLISDLQAMGVDTWHDRTLAGGQHWWEDILANIRQCDIFIFALSPESWDSEACKKELGYVVQLGKPILPVVVSDGINISLLPPPLSEIHIMDYRQCDKGASFALVKSINTASAAPPLPDPLPAAPSVPVSYLSTLKERIDSSEPLSSQAQITLLFELEEELRVGRSPMEIQGLLIGLKRRDDLLAKIAVKIDIALKSLEDLSAKKTVSAPVPSPSSAGPGSDKTQVPEAKFCPHCGGEVRVGRKFCGNCGGGLGKPVPMVRSQVIPPPPPSQFLPNYIPTVAGAKWRRYPCLSGNAGRILADVKEWLNSNDFDCQQMNMEDRRLLLQVKKRGGWRDFVGMSTALNILFHHSGDTLIVEIGGGKWIDKAAVGTVSMFILWPLAVTAGLGAWEQMKMPEKVFNYIDTRLVYR